jgi:hypothetical protein
VISRNDSIGNDSGTDPDVSRLSLMASKQRQWQSQPQLSSLAGALGVVEEDELQVPRILTRVRTLKEDQAELAKIQRTLLDDLKNHFIQLPHIAFDKQCVCQHYHRSLKGLLTWLLPVDLSFAFSP